VNPSTEPVNEVAGREPEQRGSVLLSTAAAYRLWSRVYDAQPNPMVSVEERYLESLIPDLRGRTVLDVGCGSGRWLERL
jgi:hypothetical protein